MPVLKIVTEKKVQLVGFALLSALMTLPVDFLPINGSVQDVRESQFIARMDQQIPVLMNKYSIPGVSILIIKEREPLWSKAYGFADIEQNKKLTDDAIFRVESLSKPVTTWGVMKLVERGLIKLDDPVQHYLGNWDLPQSNYNLNGVTIRRLLSNSSGMPQGTLGEEYPPNSERPSLRQYLSKEAKLAYEPGSKFEYSNPGFNLLELLIEKVTGRDFNGYMEDEVLAPLGMQNSSFNWNAEWSSTIPAGYDLQGNAVPPYVYLYKASGGLFSNVEDIARFAIAEMTSGVNGYQNVLGEESIQLIQTPQINTSGIFSFVADAYGFGHFIETLPDGKKAVWHGGQGHGWMTHFHVVPETGDGIIILTNSQRSWPFIASVLNDWSHWRGFGPVKFSIIRTAASGLWIFIGLILLIALWFTGQIGYGIYKDSRLSIATVLTSVGRFVKLALGIFIFGVLLWAVTRDYIFISSIFPFAAGWLGWALLFLSLMLLASALLSDERGKESVNQNDLPA